MDNLKGKICFIFASIMIAITNYPCPGLCFLDDASKTNEAQREIRNFVSAVCLNLVSTAYTGKGETFIGKFKDCSKRHFTSFAHDKLKNCEAVKKLQTSKTLDQANQLCIDPFHSSDSWGWKMMSCYEHAEIAASSMLEVRSCLESEVRKIIPKSGSAGTLQASAVQIFLILFTIQAIKLRMV